MIIHQFHLALRLAHFPAGILLLVHQELRVQPPRSHRARGRAISHPQLFRGPPPLPLLPKEDTHGGEACGEEGGCNLDLGREIKRVVEFLLLGEGGRGIEAVESDGDDYQAQGCGNDWN